MMETTNQTPRSTHISRSLLRCSAIFLCGFALVAGQSRITRPQSQTSSAADQRHVATLRTSDSTEGSRVTLTSDLSLNDYEAYRRGDRFYVRIPATEVPRAETLRGRGFADVRVQRSGDSVILSFRLQPGGTAHVEQRANRLDIVFTVPSTRDSNASGARFSPRSGSGTDSGANANRKTQPPKSSADQTSTRKASPAGTDNKNSAARSSANSPFLRPNARPGNENSNSARTGVTPASNQKAGSKPGESLAASGTPAPRPSATPAQSPLPSPANKPSGTPLQQKGSATPAPSATRQSSPIGATSEQPSTGTKAIKERLRYWWLLAQLNPVPVAIGLGILALFLALLIALLRFQRRRARATRRPRAEAPTPIEAAVAASPAAVVTQAPASESVLTPAVAAAGVVAATAATTQDPKPAPEPPPIVAALPPSQPSDDSRRHLVAQVAEETRNATSGSEYDADLIGSSDRDTRQLVGAELLAALVGRNAGRRERAKDLFMKHGYFDDATRDLRVAESPNERAAAARRLSFVHDREATPHLIGALQDPSPDVRRAAVEALMDARDPSAIAPLNTLMQTENDRKVPRTLIKHAIDACATAAPAEIPASAPATAPQTPPPVEPEREVIEL